MSRYIDVNKLLSDELTHRLPAGFGELSGKRYVFVEDIERLPTADVVEVVRCKDCKYYKLRVCTNDRNRVNCVNCKESYYMVRWSEFYCRYGERSEK